MFRVQRLASADLRVDLHVDLHAGSTRSSTRLAFGIDSIERFAHARISSRVNWEFHHEETWRPAERSDSTTIETRSVVKRDWD